MYNDDANNQGIYLLFVRYKRHVENIYIIGNHSRTIDVSVEMALLDGEEFDLDATIANDLALTVMYLHFKCRATGGNGVCIHSMP